MSTSVGEHSILSTGFDGHRTEGINATAAAFLAGNQGVINNNTGFLAVNTQTQFVALNADIRALTAQVTAQFSQLQAQNFQQAAETQKSISAVQQDMLRQTIFSQSSEIANLRGQLLACEKPCVVCPPPAPPLPA
jgi:hypothetical protein